MKIEKKNKSNKLTKAIDPDQAYFYTEEWQKGEAKVDEDIKAGRVYGPFNNIEDALKSLKKP